MYSLIKNTLNKTNISLFAEKTKSLVSFRFSNGREIEINLGHLWVCGHKSDGQRFYFPLSLNQVDTSDSKITSNKETIEFTGVDMDSGLAWQAAFQLSPNQPSIQWKVTLENISSQPVQIRQIGLIDAPSDGHSNILFKGKKNIDNLNFFSNGWQSWSYSGSYRANECMLRTRLGILQTPMVINPDTPVYKAKGMFSSDFFATLTDRQSGDGFVMGFLSQKQQFGTITADLRQSLVLRMWANGDDMRLDPGTSISTDWAVILPIDSHASDPLASYLEVVAQEHKISELPEPFVGWCSWYYYYQNISGEVISENLDKILELKDFLPLNVVQIDDGFQTQVGDWLNINGRFPDGVKYLAGRVKNAGLTPGLWLAPFILHPSSNIARVHPEWLLRNEKGNPVKTGFVWNSLGAALDLTHPDALEYACKVVHTAAHDWGFSYLKLDYLYAAALKGRYQNPTKTRAQVLRAGMEALREAAGPDTVLLGCGTPLGSMLGLVHAMRISADVSGNWKPSFKGISFPFKNEPSMPSVRNSIQNILSRAPMHNRWWVNDPDCLLVRPDSNLNLPEVQSLATAIALTGGSVLVSDNMTVLPKDRIRIAAVLLPPINRRPWVMDWFEESTPRKLRLDLEGCAGIWHLIAFFNWSEQESRVNLSCEDFKLKSGNYFIRSFWENTVKPVKMDESLYSGNIPSHGVVLLAVRRKNENRTQYLGSDLHISQGLEVSSWNLTHNKLDFKISAGKQLNGMIDLYLAQPPQKVFINSGKIGWEKRDKDIYRLAYPGDLISKISLEY